MGEEVFLSLENLPLNYSMAMDEENEIMIRRLTLFFVPIAFAVILVIGLIGNILVIIVVYANPQMKNTTNLLILNLAVADLLFVLVCVPFTASDYVLMYWPFGLFWCRTVQYIIYVTAYVSIYTLVLMAGDRFLAVVAPVSSLTYRTITNAKICILVTWVITIVTVTPVWQAHSLVHVQTHSYCCYDKENYSFKAFHVSFFITSFAFPVFFIIIMYIIMLIKLWRSATFRTSKEGMKAKKRVTVLVLVVVLVFMVCWAPIQIVLLHKAVKERDDWDSDFYMIVIQIVSHVLAYTNSCLNPLLYAKMSRNFRSGFSQLVPMLASSRRHSSLLQYEMTSRRKRRSSRGPRNAELPEEASKKDDSDHKDNEELITMDTKVSTTDIKMLFHTKLNNLESCVEVNNY